MSIGLQFHQLRTNIEIVEKKREVEDIVIPLLDGSNIKYPPAIKALPGAETVTVAMIPVQMMD